MLVSTIPHPHSSDDSEEAQVLLRVGLECINRFFCQYKTNRIRADFFSLLYFSLTDKWIYFIKNARSLDSVPETMEEVPEMKQAFAVANQANLSREELEDLQKREMWIHDQRNAITKAVNQAVKQKQVEIARRLLDVLDEETVSQTTGLNLEAVQQLRRDR